LGRGGREALMKGSGGGRLWTRVLGLKKMRQMNRADGGGALKVETGR
jgi:hypothetical protein